MEVVRRVVRAAGHFRGDAEVAKACASTAALPVRLREDPARPDGGTVPVRDPRRRGRHDRRAVAAIPALGRRDPPDVAGARAVSPGAHRPLWPTLPDPQIPDHALERCGRSITVGGDSRVTRVGAFLRRFKLDELPQLFNVLKGEMNFVGPRPEVARYVALYPATQRDIVLSVRPGLTDLASLAFINESAAARHRVRSRTLLRRVPDAGQAAGLPRPMSGIARPGSTSGSSPPPQPESSAGAGFPRRMRPPRHECDMRMTSSKLRRVAFVSNSASGEYTGRLRWVEPLRARGFDVSFVLPEGEGAYVQKFPGSRHQGLSVFDGSQQSVAVGRLGLHP